MRIVLSALLLLLGLPCAGSAQGAPDARLDQVEQEVDAHRFADARQALARWWTAAGDTATGERRARALYLRAVLSEDLGAAEQDLLRVAVEHPQSAFADRALFRLAQARLAHSDSVGAAAYLDRLLRDHPQSAQRAEAARLLGRPVTAASRPTPAPAAPAPRSATQRPAGPAALPSEVPGATYTVQVGSFARVPEAEALRARLRQAGFDAFLARVGGGRETLVRVGAYRERLAAQALLQRLRAAGYSGQVTTIAGR